MAHNEDQLHRLRLQLTAQKTIASRLHHVLATIAHDGPPRQRSVLYPPRHPFMRGVIVTPDLSVVVNFATTSRVLAAPALVQSLFVDGAADTLLAFAALRATLVRVFHHGSLWLLATNRRILPRRDSLADLLRAGLERGTGVPFDCFCELLDPSRVWFFLVSTADDGNVYGAGSVPVLHVIHTPWRMTGHTGDGPLLDTTPAPHCAPPPRLYDVLVYNGFQPNARGLAMWMATHVEIGGTPWGTGTVCMGFYGTPFNGVLVVNPFTLAAVRFVDLLTHIIGPIVEGREAGPEKAMERALHQQYHAHSRRARHVLQMVMAILNTPVPNRGA